MALRELEASGCIALGLSRVEFSERGDPPLSVARLQTSALAGPGDRHDVFMLLSSYKPDQPGGKWRDSPQAPSSRPSAGLQLWKELVFGRSWYIFPPQISTCPRVMVLWAWLGGRRLQIGRANLRRWGSLHTGAGLRSGF